MKKAILIILVAFTLQAHSQDTTQPAYTVITYNSDAVTINIPPVVIERSIMMQKARVHAMIFNQSSKSLSVSCDIISYSFSGSDFTDTSYLDDTNYGEIISPVMIPIRGVEIIATNASLVNPKTGEVMKNPTGQVMGQYDFFFMIATYQPVKVNELIAQYLTQNKDWK